MGQLSLVDEKFGHWARDLAPKEARIAIFEHVRDIPYAIIPELRNPVSGPPGLIEQNRGSCQPKHYLIAQSFAKLNIPTRLVTYVFKWDDSEIKYPADLKNIISRLPVSYHLACKADINGKWVLVDATWDLPLKKVGFPVNEKWDGESETINAVNSIKEIIHDAETKMKKTVEATHREFSTIRTGRASSALVEGIKVDYYGAPTPLKQLAAISVPDARFIVIQPWDKTIMGDVEKSIMKSDIGITPVNDGKVIRLSIPPLTDERRAELDKILKKIAEDGRVSIRTTRHVAVEDARKLEKDKLVAEDDRFKAQDEIQKLTNKYIKEIDTLLSAKEKEIQG